MAPLTHNYLAKDFIETACGLCFAVVQSGVESVSDSERVLCFLRYVKTDADGGSYWRKVDTGQANALLKQHFPDYLYHSDVLDADLHAVCVSEITRHHRPKQRFLQILVSRDKFDPVERDVYALCDLLLQNGVDIAQAGITGSVLIGAQTTDSDIDLVFYTRESFHQARHAVSDAVGQGTLQPLGERDWLESYARRACALTLEDYVRHERRKNNKALINGRKFDLNLVTAPVLEIGAHCVKRGSVVIRCKITGDRFGFDYPAVYALDHATVKSAVCFIATYTGQAFTGETVEIAGSVEDCGDGALRIVVGSSREAPGEYIKVIEWPA